MKDYYKILQVDRSADSELIKKIFNYHIKKNHPDLFKDKEKELAMERTQELNEAYSILSNPDKRKVYDSKFEEEENLQKQKSLVSMDRILKENEYLKEQITKKDKLIDNICNQINIDKNYFIDGDIESTRHLNQNIEYDNTETYSNKAKYLIKKAVVIFMFIIILFIMISVVTKTNMFEIFIKAFFK